MGMGISFLKKYIVWIIPEAIGFCGLVALWPCGLVAAGALRRLQTKERVEGRVFRRWEEKRAVEECMCDAALRVFRSFSDRNRMS